MSTRSLAALLVFVMLLLGGCGTLPDARPFVDATVSLSTSIRASGKVITDSMVEAGNLASAEESAYKKLIFRFDTAWSVRVAAAQGAVAYSEAIADLVSAGSTGGDAVRNASDSLRLLVESAGIPLAAPAFGAAIDLTSILIDQIALVRASASLEVATKRAQPVVDLVAERIVEDTDTTLKPILRSVYKNSVSSIKQAYNEDDTFDQVLRRHREQLRAAVLKDPSMLPKLQELEVSQVQIASILAERDRKLDQAAATYRTRRALLDALTEATWSWAQAHRDLVAAIQSKRTVSVTELVAAIDELKTMTKKVRDL